MTILADEMLTHAVDWVYGANDEVNHWENVREDARQDASGKSSDNEEERKLRRRKADAAFRMADVGRTASREIQRAALEELTNLQREVLVKEISVSDLDVNERATATAVLRTGRSVPADHRFYWMAGDLKVEERSDPHDDAWLSVVSDATKLPIGDTAVAALLGKALEPPVKGM